MPAKSNWHLCYRSIDAAKGWPNTGRISQPDSAICRRVCRPQDQRHRIANRPVLLIDDVMTTGATLYEAAKTLHRAGSGPVRGLVLARVLRHGL